VRIAHWVNALCLFILVMSGLQIFNAHPAVYWGEDSDFERPLLSIYVAFTPDGRPMGITSVLGQRYDTTGVLGRSALNGRPVHRAFPGWLTLPSTQDLATGRVWHLFFAWVFVLNGVLYLAHSIVRRRFSRELIPQREQWRGIGRTLGDHLRFRLDRTAEYNVLQKLTYLTVILVIAPLIVLTGLTMSPAVTAAAPWLLDVFGGRQSARTIHFVVTMLFMAFVLVHVLMVVVSGFFNNMRSMTTGWYATLRRDAP
jgi:thiosulfate reductase cytochrome b subunit